MSGADNGSVILTNLATNRQDFFYNHDCEIKKIMFLSPFECMVACDARGGVVFLSSQQGTRKEKKLLQMTFKTKSIINQETEAPVQALTFASQHKYLILGGEFGVI